MLLIHSCIYSKIDRNVTGTNCVPFYNVKKKAKFEDEEIRLSGSNDRVEKVLLYDGKLGYTELV